ncbi:hypothetical protein NA57DRAFT_57682 [Rhizodiscina lignyota]|uniref:Uncharacterized protein n=1 Tax=Rhizodiscina lignyota TaxID=1504668 RepID=A0A9P4M4M9_9PEZI|nr:hypothetical protein NA57DRAFT_57682 [Rhizodiscina lignyota]
MASPNLTPDFAPADLATSSPFHKEVAALELLVLRNAKFIYRGLFNEFQIILGQAPLESAGAENAIDGASHTSSRSASPLTTPLPNLSPTIAAGNDAEVETDPLPSSFHPQRLYAALIGIKPTALHSPGKESLLLRTYPCIDEYSAKRELFDLTVVEVDNRLSASAKLKISLEKLATSAKAISELPDGWRMLIHETYGMICFANDNLTGDEPKVTFQLPGYEKKARRIAVKVPKQELIDETIAEFKLPSEGGDSGATGAAGATAEKKSWYLCMVM